MNHSHPSRFCSRFNFLDRMMYPMAIKGIPISLMLRILSICLIGFFSLYHYYGWNDVYIRNVHIVIFITIFYTAFIYADDSIHNDSVFFYIITFGILISNIFVFFDTGYEPGIMNQQYQLIVTDMTNLFFISFSLISIKDRHFYSNYLMYSRIPKNKERLFAYTRSLIYGKDYLYDFEMKKLLKSISYFYSEMGYPLMTARADKLLSCYNEYILNMGYLTRRDTGLHSEFNNADELINQANAIEKKTNN